MDPTVKGYRVFQVCPYSSVPSKAIPIGTITAPAVGLLGSCSAIDHTRGLFYATMPLPPSGAGNVSDSGWSVPGAPLHTARLHVNGTVESQLRTSEHHQQHVASGSAPPPPPPPMPKFEIDLMTVYYKGPKKGQMHRIKMSEANSISTCAFDSVAKKVRIVCVVSRRQEGPHCLCCATSPRRSALFVLCHVAKKVRIVCVVSRRFMCVRACVCVCAWGGGGGGVSFPL